MDDRHPSFHAQITDPDRARDAARANEIMGLQQRIASAEALLAPGCTQAINIRQRNEALIRIEEARERLLDLQ